MKESRAIQCERALGGYGACQRERQPDLSNPYMTGLAIEVENTPVDSSSESNYSSIPDVTRDYSPVSTPETAESPD